MKLSKPPSIPPIELFTELKPFTNDQKKRTLLSLPQNILDDMKEFAVTYSVSSMNTWPEQRVRELANEIVSVADGKIGKGNPPVAVFACSRYTNRTDEIETYVPGFGSSFRLYRTSIARLESSNKTPISNMWPSSETHRSNTNYFSIIPNIDTTFLTLHSALEIGNKNIQRVEEAIKSYTVSFRAKDIDEVCKFVIKVQSLVENYDTIVDEVNKVKRDLRKR